MKSIKTVIILILPLLLFNSCEDKKQDLKVGLCMDAFVQERWQKDRDLFTERVKELGGEVMMEAAQGDPILQFEQAKKLIEKGAKVLVIVPVDSKKASKIVEYAIEKNVHVIAYDRLIKDCQLDYYVSTDHVEVGELMAEYLIKRKPKGKYCIIGGATSDNNSFLLRLGQLNVLHPLIEKGDIIKVYDEYTTAWKREEGKRHMEKCLEANNNEVDVVIAGNDDLAAGAIDALEAQGLAGKVLVAGQDADLQAVRNIIKGIQTISVYKPIKQIAYTAADLAIKLLKQQEIHNANITVNNGIKMVPTVLLPAMVVNKDNIDLTVVADGYIDKRDL